MAGALLAVLLLCGAAPQRGTETTDTSREAFSLPSPSLAEEDREAFFRGRTLFRQVWVVAPAQDAAVDGLGPTYNRLSCLACHPKNGRGFAPEGPDEEMRAMLVRLSIPGDGPLGGPRPHPAYGDQLNDHGIPGVPAEGRARIVWETRRETFTDGETVELRRPRLEWKELAFGPIAPDVQTSPRIGQPVYGLGLLEAVPERTLEALAAREGPGGGRLNRVWSVAGGRQVAGRFGWKANQSDLRQQVAAAAHGDLGLTSSLFPEENCPPVQYACAAAPGGGAPELADAQLDDLVTYLRMLAVPARRGADHPDVREGERLFASLGCEACHVPVLETGSDPPGGPALAHRRIAPYSDLLLHDMGDDLADGRPDFLASGREWRTPPLWGIGLARRVDHRAGFLHDGRARTLVEAILWHGGQAAPSRERFRAATRPQRAALVAFLESL